MTETKVEDVLIPLLKNHYDKGKFNESFNDIRKYPKPLYLDYDFEFSINFIRIITSNELKDILKSLNDPEKFEHIKKDENDSIDYLFLNKKGIELFNRNIFKYNEKIEIVRENCNCISEKFQYGLFINIADIKSEKYNKIPYHIISLILTSFNHKNNNLCNKQIIKLVKNNCFSSLNYLPENIRKLLEKDTFVAIQLWNNRWESEKDNIFDAKTYVEKNPYYFYSILTLEENVFRRTYENIMDALGWCQSASSAYFDVFYGTTCLELTVKPNPILFEETGHDSEEFRIWELLALQKKLLGEINQKEMNNVDNCIEELDLIYNFNDFTKKRGKGEKWIRYGKYLQKITGIDSDYQDYKLKNEMKNKEYEQKLQKLNIFIIVSIFASFLTLLLNPIYNSLASTDNDPSLNSTINLTIDSTNYFDFTHLFKNPNPEFAAIIIASILTFVSILSIGSVYVKISEMKIPNKIKQHQIIEKLMKLKKYSIYISIFLLIIFLIYFINW